MSATNYGEYGNVSSTVSLSPKESNGGGNVSSLALLPLLLHGGGRMVVKSLGHELQSQAVLVPRGLFNLGPLILEPDFDLGLVEVEFLRQRLPPLLRDVPVGLKLGFQSLQLLGRERLSVSSGLMIRVLHHSDVLLHGVKLKEHQCDGSDAHEDVRKFNNIVEEASVTQTKFPSPHAPPAPPLLSAYRPVPVPVPAASPCLLDCLDEGEEEGDEEEGDEEEVLSLLESRQRLPVCGLAVSGFTFSRPGVWLR
ncbi:hypothetical protein F7725_008996 [Dissostichus mawsoni]|uniref:Uncharacterized protein n=1 Tax=Dissostichus mawsoni TaxID=36200 RepID=A0A7J5Z8W1_DISMA|nr:hypothetical protein F7725_008996 [Dissostichus mawsoni]